MSSVASQYLSPLWIGRLVHENVAERPLLAARHRAFIAPRLVSSAVLLLAAPLWLFLFGPPTQTQTLLFLVAQTPLASIVLLARSGNLRMAQNLSILGWVALAAVLQTRMDAQAVASVACLSVALIEALLASETALAVMIEIGVIGLLTLGGGASDAPFSLTQAATLAAPLGLYVALIAFSMRSVEQARAQDDAKNTRERQLLSGVSADIVLRIDSAGDVRAVMSDTQKSYRLDSRALTGRGFFRRLHIADRPSFLKLVSSRQPHDAPIMLRARMGDFSDNASDSFAAAEMQCFEARLLQRDALSDGAYICALRDVTATVRAQETLAAAQAESERATESRTRVLANISHELRTPLNAIIGFADMLASPALAPADLGRQREYAGIISTSAQHLLAVVNTIIDISKIDSGAMQITPEAFSLSALLDQCCDMMQMQADQSGVTLQRDYRADIGEFVADRRACKQIVINLLSNAVKFTPAGGRVQIRVAPDRDHLAIAVIDTGVGIAAHDLANIGKPFFQANAAHDRANEGTGLGLSVVRGLVGLHNGAITLESAPRNGTTVTVRLPLQGDATQAPAAGAADIKTIARRGALLTNTLDIDQLTVKKIA